MNVNLILLLFTLTTTIVHSHDAEDNNKNLETSTTAQDTCKKTKQNVTQEFIDQLEIVEGIEMKTFDVLYILTTDHFNDNRKFLQHLTNDSRILNFSRKTRIRNYSHNYTLSLVNGNIFLYSMNQSNIQMGYYLYPPSREIKNEFFFKYFTKKLVDKAQEIKVLMNTNVNNRAISLINNVYDLHLKNDTKEPMNTTEIVLLTNFYLNRHSTTNKSFLNCNLTNELKFSEEVNCLKLDINNDLIASFHSLSDAVFAHYFGLEKNSTDMEALSMELSNAHVFLLNAVEETSRVIDAGKPLEAEDFEALKSAYSLLQIHIPKDNITSIITNMNMINFLRMATGEWIKPSLVFDPIRTILEIQIGASALWYKKLYVAYVAASRCLSNNLHDTMKAKINYLSEHAGFKVLNSNVKDRQLKLLSHHSFNRDINKECILMDTKTEEEVYKLQIYGDFINFKDIPDIEICKGRTKYIELFARELLTIDWDLVRIGEVLQVVAIAPKWIISGTRRIDLTGAVGAYHEMESAEDGQLGLRGDDGLPGLPGGPGGIFIGIAEEIINKDSLLIFADGGQGGPGQHGGKGGEGPDPRLPTIDDYDQAILLRTEERPILFPLQGFDVTCLVYYFDLLTMSLGGDGGNGGKGGNGGSPGQISLIQLTGTFEEHSLRHGQMGHNGVGGDGGLGNYKNQTIEEKCSTDVKDTTNCKDCDPAEKMRLVLRNGTAGHDGCNPEGMKVPVEFKGLRDFAFVVNDYKNYARPYLMDSRNQEISEFYTKLLENEVINGKYGTIGLLEELKGLERQYVNLTGNVDLLPMYDNLQKRIEKYTKHRWDSEKGEDYKVTLGYAYTAALCRSSRLIESGYFVSHLQNYVDSVSTNLDKLKDDSVQYTANQLGEDYKQNIERKIKEAQIIIETQLKNEVSRVNKMMKRKIYDLITETSGLKNVTYKKKEALKSAMLQQSIFTLIKSALVGISALIPGGQAAAIVTFTVIQVGESFAPEYPKQKFQTKIPVAVGNRFAGALEFVKNSKLEQQKILEKDIKFLRKKKNSLYDGPSKIINKLISLFDNKDSEVNKTNLESEIKELDGEVEKFIQEEEDEDDEDGTDVLKVLDIVSRMRAYFSLKQKNSDAVELLENDTEKKECIKEDLTSVENDIKKLQNYENRIFNELIPVLEKMRQDLPLDETLRVQSVAALDVSKWKVQSALKKIKLIVKQFTEGFKVADEMNLIIENMEDVMNTLISIYDQIQNFQQEKKLAAYVKQLSNAKFLNFHSNNEMLENSVLETRLIIRGNLALIQYEKVFKAFKQLVFPFVKKYLNDLHKPSIFEISTIADSDFPHWFADISENVHKIRNKIDEIQATVFKSSKFNERLEYGNKHQGEFYLWENGTYNEMISDLLDGKEVILSPDVRNFPHYAVKFKKIRIGFIAKNRADQGPLTELLNALEMRMTHEGNSYYTCGNKMYLISHSPITLVKTFNESYQGESDSVQKLASGDDLVSPFATWRVKISKATGGIEDNYFVDFKNKVDLVLEGIGTYVQVTSTDVCDKDTSLSEYYEEYVPIVDIPQ